MTAAIPSGAVSGGYVLVSACNNGRQVAFVMGRRIKGDTPEVKLVKWRRQGRMWTNPAWYPATNIVGEATESDLRKYKVSK
jgi:hypothetical protein